MLSSRQGSLEGPLVWGHAVIPVFFSPIFLQSAAGDEGIIGSRGMQKIYAGVGALGSLMERENEKERKWTREMVNPETSLKS